LRLCERRGFWKTYNADRVDIAEVIMAEASQTGAARDPVQDHIIAGNIYDRPPGDVLIFPEMGLE
jgi:hypothetical protein